MNARGRQICTHLNEPVDVLLVKNNGEPFIDDNFFYLTEAKHGLFEGCTVLAYPDRRMDVLVSRLEQESASQIDASLHVYSSKEEHDSILSKLVGTQAIIGVNYQRWTYHDISWLKKLVTPKKLVDTSQAFQQSRLIKDNKEVSHIKKACHITDKVTSQLTRFIIPGMKESELAAEIEYQMKKNGAHQPAFTTISSFGKHTAEPHYTHGDTKLEGDVFIVCDFGARFNRYNADSTRTLFYGNPNKEHQSMYETVLAAQQHAFDMIQPGKKASVIYQQVVDFINNTKWKHRFIHSLGHSLGLAVHDGPGFSASSTLVLEEGMVLTVEPGIYIPGVGGVRIEDDILITKQGFKLLTTSSKELLIV